MPSGVHSFFRPGFSRQRSNSVPNAVPTFSLANVSAEETNIIFSAAERATARRKRPVSVDSPGPAINLGRHQDSLPERAFNFSTPSRFGIGKSPLRNASTSSPVRPSFDFEREKEQKLREEAKPTALPQRQLQSPAPIKSARPPSVASSLPSDDPTSPRRPVANPNLKAYADGLLRFTQSRLNTVAPQSPARTSSQYSTSIPTTPELELDIMELRQQRPPLASHFSDWSSTAADSEASSPHLSFVSPLEPRTPDEESGMLSPDSFFNEITPRVAQSTQWAGLSSARPSSRGSAVFRPYDSPTRGRHASSNTNSEVFSYFSGFDSATAAVTSRFSSDCSSPNEVVRTPYTPSGAQPQSRGTNICRPASSASNRVPFSRVRAHTPLSEMIDLQRPPSWLVQAIG